MYDEGANAIQVVLMLGSPIYGGLAGYLYSTHGHLRPYGGLALAAAIVFASFGLAQAMEVVRAGGVAEYGVRVLALPGSAMAAAALIATALSTRRRGGSRRAMFAVAGLLFPLSVLPLFYSIGILYVIVAWVVCFTLAVTDPPLRTSELRPKG